MSYGKVKDTFWTDKKVQAFSDDAKMLALYLLTGPHRNILGCMRIPNGYITEDLKWASERLADAMAMLCERQFVCRDDEGWTLILNQLKHDPIKVPNHARAAIAIANTVPVESSVYQSLKPRLVESLKTIGMASEWHPNEIAIPEPSPEPLPAPAPEPVGVASPSALPPAPIPISPAKDPKAKGSRLPSNWTLPDEWRAWTTTELLPMGSGLPAIMAWIDRTALRFRDHWLAKAGKDGVKTDWQATWRNWIRRDLDDGKGPTGAADPAAPATTIPPEKRLRQITLDERDLAARVHKFCGEMTSDAEVAKWRELDQQRAA